jgi:arginine utilization protein RocB
MGERVHKEYSFIELPKLLARLTRSTLDLDGNPSKDKVNA